ncbi:aggregation-promoting factor C-terminal-like domain-containing protein [Phaeacidiphilus oryzae]|uniref:aggregation-promoting factor C-terminal-like domain-containing protein n=1 Tax=Phaeacidiphilus oryzae TaxID=348818 RepID=UPI0007C81A21|nr:hypothetical protein [Phaeacidiphilus oryzae]
MSRSTRTTARLRLPAAIVAGAAGLTALGGLTSVASAATPGQASAQVSAHQQHVAHQAHLNHLNHAATVSAHQRHLTHQGHLNHAAAVSAHQDHLAHLAHSSHAAAAAAPAATASTGVSTRAVSATTSAPSGSPQQIAAQLVPADQLASFEQIISHESGWNVHATNASSGAYGLGQALPGSKMASAGADWQNSAATQIKWALSYMNDRYGSPNAAWASWQANGWY